MNEVTPLDLARYYQLRAVTGRWKITDGAWPRPIIRRDMPIRAISREYYERCYKSELDALDIGLRLSRLDRAAIVREAVEELAKLRVEHDDWRNEAIESRGEINSLRSQLGLPGQDFAGA